jgi:hypothetical protein
MVDLFFIVQPDLGEGARNAKAAMRIMIRIGTQLVDDKKTAVLQHIEEVGTVKQAHVMGRDLLSTISESQVIESGYYLSEAAMSPVRANMSADLDPTQRLSDEEVLARALQAILTASRTDITNFGIAEISTFLVAGHETTAYGPSNQASCILT